MAYAFSRVDDYFRRNKTGGTGSLEKGTNGAPPPTAAAESLAKTASNSQGQESGNQYAALKGANTSAIQGRLSGETQREASQWETGATNTANAAQQSGEKQITDTYKSYNPADLTGAEQGAQPSTSRLSEQVGYTGKELNFAPVQVSAPKFDTSSMLSGGVGGIQAALQRSGGRYTPGMGALDATALAANNQALAGLRSRLGDISSKAADTKTRLEQTDENLASTANTLAGGIRGQVREAIGGRLQDLYKGRAADAASKQVPPGNMDDYIRQGVSQGFDWNSPVMQNRIAQMRNLGILPDVTQFGKMTDQTGSIGPTAAETNLSTILGVGANPAANYGYQTFGQFDPNAYFQAFYQANQDPRLQATSGGSGLEQDVNPSAPAIPTYPGQAPMPGTPNQGALAITGGTRAKAPAPGGSGNTGIILPGTQGLPGGYVPRYRDEEVV